MWSDRKNENQSSRWTGNQENRTDPIPPRVPAPASNRTVIGQAMVITGQVWSREDLQVEGEVDGSLELPDFRLTVGPKGKVGAGAIAREVEVLGTVTGDVEASKKVTIRRGGRLVGDLRTPGIVIEDGAYFKGKIEIVNTEEQADDVPGQPDRWAAAAGGVGDGSSNPQVGSVSSTAPSPTPVRSSSADSNLL
jgi:cytoskeletal protein CcmA (bactofilin family)